MRLRLLIGRVAVVAVAVVLAVVRFVALDAASHSASDTLRPWAIELVAIGLVALLVLWSLDRLVGRRQTS